ncbi:MAG: NDP-sugar synthase [Candidatus Eisenbacteria bacterium]|jgi:NDP-sugar pyrophosphorylase family protein|nr:NDP-sugar synthase [Candidatus Eisenbacteria bacterium]
MKVKALLLAAGKGTRLWPLTEVRAKAAVPYRGVPLVRTLARQLLAAGINDIAVNLHHLPDSVRAALDGVPATFSMEEELLGTSGALHALRSFLDGAWFWSINAKIAMAPMPPRAIHEEPPQVITAVLAPAPPGVPYTRVDVSGDPPRIVGFRGADTQDGSGLFFTGVQLVGPRVWEFLPEPGFSHFPSDVYPRLHAAGQPVGAWVVTDTWQEFSTLERYLRYHLQSGASPAWWGKGVRVSGSARVSESVLWDGVVVERLARIHQCILADGVRIPSGRTLDRVAVVPLDRAGHDPRGEVLDDNLVVAIPS